MSDLAFTEVVFGLLHPEIVFSQVTKLSQLYCTHVYLIGIEFRDKECCDLKSDLVTMTLTWRLVTQT